MGFTPFSQVVRPAEFQNPMDLNLYAQGTQYKEQLAKQNLQDVSALHNSIFNIPTYGKDKEKLIEIEQGLEQQLQGMNLSNLGNMETASQIRNMIGQAANNPEVQGIAQRYGSYAQELKKKQDAEAKGKTYISPIIDQAEEYYGSGVYKTDTRFNQTGWLDPELEKRKLEIMKDIPKVTKNVKVGNYWVPVTTPDADALKIAYEGLYNDPNVRKSQEYNFNRAYKNVDWATQGTQELQDGISKAQTALAINPNDTKAQEYIQKYSPLLQNPQKLGEFVKNRTMQETIQKQIQDDIAAANYVSEGKMDADDFVLKAVEHQNRMAEDLYKLQLKTGLTPERGESQQAYLQRASKAAQDRDLEIAQAKSDISLNRQLELEKAKQEGRLGVLEYKTKSATKLPSKLKNLISTLDTGTALNTAEQEDLEALIKTHKAELGAPGEANITDVTVKDGNVVFKKEVWGADKEYKVPIDKFKEVILKDNESITTPKSGSSSYTFQGTNGKTLKIDISPEEETDFLKAHPEAKKQ